MSREYYLRQAAQGLCLPVATDMVLHSHADADAIREDGNRLGDMIAEAARRFDIPLAVPLMDLSIEKETILEALGVPAAAIEKYHFDQTPDAAALDRLRDALKTISNPRLRTQADAIHRVREKHADLVPMGMCIGPFSLMTKMLADPVTPVYLAGTGATAEEDDEVATLDALMEMAVETILASLKLQAEAGATAIFECEPAANTVYLSPRQVEEGSDVFERYVLAPNRRIRDFLAKHHVDWIFHDCGDLTPDYVRMLADLRPEVLSLGSPVRLWEAAALTPKDVPLFGNLPSKKFFSDTELPEEKLRQMTRDLIARMRETKHPFLLSTECDVLNVPGKSDVILRKIDAFLDVGRTAGVA